MQTADKIRESFLRYFEKNGHQRVKSSSLVPIGDSTLLFTNAGMNQFKDTFTGLEQRDYKKATSSQKCVRAGGKHNDLENVGRTARHQTFFEMLGNFSFGDYFKEEAIFFAWNFLTKELDLDKNLLSPTIYKDDNEALSLWKKIANVNESRIYRFGEKDNYWSMGDTGPNGPCSEIFYDWGEKYSCGSQSCAPGCDCDRYVEIWNLVFMQYNTDSNNNKTVLPQPSIDTGMGLERITAVLQNKHSNYGTDLIYPVIEQIADTLKIKYKTDENMDISMRVLADHARATAFLVSDGVIPSNEGRGYVLRRIIRRAIRHGRKINLPVPFFNSLCLKVVDYMSAPYPELIENKDFISNIAFEEEKMFLKTLDSGLKILEEEIIPIKRALKEGSKGIIPGSVVFKLYGTHGFPVDLTGVIAKENNLSIDEEGFNIQIEKERKRAKFKSSNEQENTEIYHLICNKIGKTIFTGYEKEETDCIIKSIIFNDKEVNEIKADQVAKIVLNETPFYGESGGQVGDNGYIMADDAEFKVKNTIKPVSDFVVHKGILKGNSSLKVGQKVKAKVSKSRRQQIRLNHSATHLLQSALRKILGQHVKQSGSLVEPERLRFDYSHFSPLTREEIEKIEKFVNEKICENIQVDTKIKTFDEAKNDGAIALFGEKYGNTVRMVQMGDASLELCGGTHVKQTGEIGIFKITSDESLASGIRRIEASTGIEALYYIHMQEQQLIGTADLLKDSPTNVKKRVELLIKKEKELSKEIDRLNKKISTTKSQDQMDKVKIVNDIKVLSVKTDIQDPAGLRDFADKCRDQMKSGIVALGTVKGKKVILLVAVTKDLINKYHSGKLVKEMAGIVGGGGGGKPDMAQAGGSKPEKLDEALNHIFNLI